MKRMIVPRFICLLFLMLFLAPACAFAAPQSAKPCILLPASKDAAQEKATVRVKIYKKKVTMETGDTLWVRWNLWYRKKHNGYRVYSTKPAVADCSISGAYIGIQAKSVGKAKIVLKSGSKKATCTVTVKAPKPVPEPAPIFPVVEFGHYEQDNNTDNGMEPIQWYKLESEGNLTLLVSRYCLDTVNECRRWSTSPIRQWLNGTFLNRAFSASEQAAIADSQHETYMDDTTTDKVFMLLKQESPLLFASNATRVARPTAYAIAKGVKPTRDGNCWWWLRNNTYVSESGSMYSYPDYVGTQGANRPAIWVDLGKM